MCALRPSTTTPLSPPLTCVCVPSGPAPPPPCPPHSLAYVCPQAQHHHPQCAAGVCPPHSSQQPSQAVGLQQVQEGAGGLKHQLQVGRSTGGVLTERLGARCCGLGAGQGGVSRGSLCWCWCFCVVLAGCMWFCMVSMWIWWLCVLWPAGEWEEWCVDVRLWWVRAAQCVRVHVRYASCK
jgi:hypothetical protein